MYLFFLVWIAAKIDGPAYTRLPLFSFAHFISDTFNPPLSSVRHTPNPIIVVYFRTKLRPYASKNRQAEGVSPTNGFFSRNRGSHPSGRSRDTPKTASRV